MKEWKKELCSEMPETLQLIAPDLYIERKDIVQVEYKSQGNIPAYIGYECMSREISVSEYEMLQSIEAIQTNKDVSKAIDDYTMQLIEGGLL